MGAEGGMLSLRALNTITVTLALGLVALAGWHVQNPAHFELIQSKAAAVPVQQTTELSFLQTSNFVDQIYLYAGLAVDNKHETGFIAKEIRKHNYQTMVRLFTSLDDATFRAVLWDQSVHCLVWPPFVRYPGISETAKTDLRAYAAAGNNVVFLGNYVAVQFMNDVFGFQLTDDYQNGPYYRNDRNVRNTPYQYLPSRVEQASIETYAVKTRSLPPGGKSMLDTLGATVAFVIRYDLGTVVYIGYNYNTPFHADQWTRVLHCAIDIVLTAAMYMQSNDSQGAGAWAKPMPYMMQMVQVPMMTSPTGAGAMGDPRGNYFAPMPAGDMSMGMTGFKYKSDNIVLAAGQYREVRPVMANNMLAQGGYSFHIEPANLPQGLQLDPASGTIWGTPAAPPAGSDPAAAYAGFTVTMTGPGGSCSTNIGMKVVHFQPQNFKITHVTQLERNKYMVMIDTKNLNRH